ncbi:MAG: polysaccharide pyruvyl transferase family protein [Aquaticitalea sp.]
MKKIVIYCACDRLNYGDLLFPLILKEVLSKNGHNHIEIVATTKSDLSVYGALKTQGYGDLWNDNHKDEKDILIIAGGEVLETEWSSTLSFLSRIFYNIYHRVPFKEFLNKFAQRKIGNVKEILPFVPSSSDLLNRYHLIYNAVGGNKVSTNKHSDIIEKSLANAIYTSFRNKSLYDDIKDNFSNVNPELSPDSALIMSDIFTQIKPKQVKNYIVFQVGYFKSMNKLELIAKQLDQLQKKINVDIILMPIGFCAGHDDLKALQLIKGHLDNEHIKIRSEKNIFSLMELIAGSKLFIGTSLHGVITAMSFNVPYLGLNPNIKKLQDYLGTWGVKGLDSCTAYEDIASRATYALKIEKEHLIENSKAQKAMVYQSLNNISNTINTI